MNLSSRKLVAWPLFAGGRRIRQRSGWRLAGAPWVLAEGALALYVGSSEHFALVSVVRRDQNASHLTVFEYASASLLAR
jgi:hypothetical protein